MTTRRTNSGNESIAHRLPGFDAQHATRRSRTAGRLVASLAVVAAAAVLTLYFTGYFGRAKGSGTNSTNSSQSSGRSSASAGSSSGSSGRAGTTPSVTASLFSPQLPAPITRTLVLPGTGTQIVIAGGATSGGVLAQGIFTLDTSNGKLQHVANFTTGTDGAAGAVVGGADVTFGGDAPGPIPDVQSLPIATSSSTSSGSTSAAHGAVQSASPIGALPQARANAGSATIGQIIYIAGGDNGSAADAQVVSTTDGRTFNTVASLQQPVTFAAVAGAGSNVYVLGGESSTAPGSWSPVNTIQKVEPSHHRSVVVGHLPVALAGASAVSVGNGILVIGGTTGAISTSSSPPAPAPTTSSTTSAAGPVVNTEASIWWWDPATGKTTLLGQLPQAVSQAGVVESGSTVWVVGGTANGSAVSALQTITVTAHAASSGGTRSTG